MMSGQMDEPTDKWMDRQMKRWTYDGQTGEWMVWEIGGGTEKRERQGERGRNYKLSLSYRLSNKLENFCSSTAMGDQFFF